MKRTICIKSLFVAGLMAGLAGCASNPPAKTESQMESPSRRAASASPMDAASPAEPPARPTEPRSVLTLRDAVVMALYENPELAPYAWQERADEARQLQAGLRINPVIGLEVEDVLGTGDFQGVQEAQSTLLLSQVIELGGKRTRRIEAAAQARGRTQTEYELKRVEVLGDVAQRFIQVVASQHTLDLALTNRQLAEEALLTVQERVKAGKGSALEERKSQVALARSEVIVEGARHDLSAARKRLSAMWRSSQPRFERAEADLFHHQPIPGFEDLLKRISTSPEIASWVSPKNLREAELKLAEAERKPDLTIGGGPRWFSGPDDLGFVFGLSVPLQLFDRNQAGVAEARALLGRTEAERAAAEARLRMVLLGLYEEMVHDTHVMDGLQKEILPRAEDALAIATEGFAGGRFSYLEVLDAQRTVFEVKQEYIQTATTYHQFLVEIERLIGRPIDEGAGQP